ncbi:MAG TPA: VWA domain-containing protein [Solirubrobacteraceae bacterium]|nr:VWA domain-containing protein [Solirubrobacteraceae bacterium]
MGFSAPIWLLALAAVPVAVALHRLNARRSPRYAIRFPAAASAARAVGAAPRWPRHVPAALLLAGVACLALALARPHVPHRVPTNSASLMLVTDHSLSMQSDDVSPTRLAAAQTAANTFIDQLPSTVRVGAIGFSTVPDRVQGPSTDHRLARRTIDAETPGGGTATGNALALALQLLRGADPHHPPAAIVLLSDGAANQGQDPVQVAQLAARERIPIYTVALGTPSGVLVVPGQVVPVPPDPALMAQIARTSGARAFNAQNSDALSAIYQRLGSELSTVIRPRDITVVFVIAGALLLLLGAAASVRRSGRLV